MRTTKLMAIAAFVAVCSAWGCKNCCRRPCRPPIGAPAPLVSPLPAPPIQGAAPPPAPFPSSPPAGNAFPGAAPEGFAPPPPGNGFSGAAPEGFAPAPPAGSAIPGSPSADAWQPGPREEVRLSPPEPASPPTTPEATRPEQPITPEPPLAGPSAPGAGDVAPTTPSLPSGIPYFAEAKARVATGQTPFSDGWDWLKANGYRTVLHLRKPGTDDSADRKQAEQRGLVFRRLDVSPETLTADVVEEFNRIVDDRSQQPLFVYDTDGAAAGALWYLHFRTAENASDQIARDQAERLGLQREPTGDHLTMWVAVQKLLSQLGIR